MRAYIFISLLIVISFSSCRQEIDLQDQLTATQAELMLVKAELAKAQIPVAITHLVYLDTKEGIDRDALTEELSRLGEISGVKNYQIGHFLDLGDPRALSQHELVLSMGFDSQEAYQAYQQHPTHLEVKTKLGVYLAGPPVTYDFE
jgi:hypothetical protein